MPTVIMASGQLDFIHHVLVSSVHLNCQTQSPLEKHTTAIYKKNCNIVFTDLTGIVKH